MIQPAKRSTAHQKNSTTIDQFMTQTPETIGLKQPLSMAHRIMREHNIRHLPVLDAGKVVGLVSQRDLHLVETLKGVDPKVVAVDEAMTLDPYCVSRDASLEDVVREMARHKYGSAIIVEGERPVGIFTVVDALEALAWALDRRA